MKTQAFLVTVTSLILGLSSVPAFATGDSFGTRGGDDVGIEFSRTINDVIADVASFGGAAFPELSTMRLAQVAKDVKIIVVADALIVTPNGTPQESVAVNQPAAMLILVNRARWAAIIDEAIRRSVVFHELLGLMGIEDSALYQLSGRYAQLVADRASAERIRRQGDTLPLQELLTAYYSNLQNTDVSAQDVRVAALEKLSARAEDLADFDSMWSVARVFLVAKAAEDQYYSWACQKQDEVLLQVVQKFPGSGLVRDRTYPQRRVFHEFCNAEVGFYRAFAFLRAQLTPLIGKFDHCALENPDFVRYLDIAGQVFSIQGSGYDWVDREVQDFRGALWADIRTLGCTDVKPENFLTYYP